MFLSLGILFPADFAKIEGVNLASHHSGGGYAITHNITIQCLEVARDDQFIERYEV